MARFHLIAALTTTTFAVLVSFQLISNIDLPSLDILSSRWHAYKDPSTVLQQSVNPPVWEPHALRDGTQYLLGVGKADITGYAP